MEKGRKERMRDRSGWEKKGKKEGSWMLGRERREQGRKVREIRYRQE